MNMYEAVKAAAIHIGAHPELYSFATTAIPPDGRNGTGCMLGRIAQLVGFDTVHANEVAPALLKTDSTVFFDRISRIIRDTTVGHKPRIFDDPRHVAPALLIYAEKYRNDLEALEYPPGKIPKSVTDIFKPQAFNGLFIAAGGVLANTKAHPLGGSGYSVAVEMYVKA
jgi:hypothetical protein